MSFMGKHRYHHVALASLLSWPLSSHAADIDWAPLQWLAGCWQSTTADAGSVEHWLGPAGEMMLGVSRTLRAGKPAEFEFLRIHRQDGQLFYTAKPSGQPEASFKLVSTAGQQLLFENPEHDFPQRISYRLNPDGSLLARIEGQFKGKTRSRDFPMNRIKCD